MQRNALLQRDDALVTCWLSLKLRLPKLLALVEFHFDGGIASRNLLSRWGRVGVEKELKTFLAIIICFFQNCCVLSLVL